MGVFVVGDGLLDVALQAVDGEVHLGQADGGGVLLQAEEGEPVHRVFMAALDEAGALDEHAARAAGRVEHDAALRREHVGDERDQRDRREELAAVVGLLVGELGEEVFVDAAEHVARDLFEFFRVEGAQELAEDGVVEFLIFSLGEHTAQVLVVFLDGLHRLDDGLGPVVAVGQRNQIVKLGLGPEKDGALLREVRLGERPCLAAARGQVRFDVSLTAR